MKKIVTIEDHLSAEMAMMYCLADMLETQQVIVDVWLNAAALRFARS